LGFIGCQEDSFTDKEVDDGAFGPQTAQDFKAIQPREHHIPVNFQAGSSKGSLSRRGGAQIVFANNNWNTAIQGVTPDYLTIRDVEIAPGRRGSNRKSGVAQLDGRR
jgi:hypothetical protein